MPTAQHQISTEKEKINHRLSTGYSNQQGYRGCSTDTKTDHYNQRISSNLKTTRMKFGALSKIGDQIITRYFMRTQGIQIHTAEANSGQFGDGQGSRPRHNYYGTDK